MEGARPHARLRSCMHVCVARLATPLLLLLRVYCHPEAAVQLGWFDCRATGQLKTSQPRHGSRLQALTPLQNSRLLLGCAPYLPDCTQLCRLLEWQEQRQQVSRGDSGHFLATAVAV